MTVATQAVHTPSAFEALLASERPRLVRLCARLSGDAAAGEDLAQETLFEAWRRRERLTDWSGADRWLATIARYVCLRWRRRQGREWARAAPRDPDLEIAEQAVDPLDLEQALEEQELAALIERALDLLSPETRRLLLLRYVEELPQAEIAERLRLSEGAVAMRLQRGRQTVRRLLSEKLEETAAYGLSDQELQIWCPFCGRSRILLRREANGWMIFYCGRCSSAGSHSQIVGTMGEMRLQKLKHPRAILSRSLAFCHSRYRAALAEGSTRCWRCGALFPIEITGESRSGVALQLACPGCGAFEQTPVHYLVLDLPETQRFWQAYPRMRLQASRPVSLGGRAALLTTYASLEQPAALEVLSDAETLEVLAIEGGAQ